MPLPSPPHDDTASTIQNAERVPALMRMDMDNDPSPDLAIEADVTSKTTLEAYATLQVPEVWIYQNGRLTIYLLQDANYQPHATSQVFLNLLITIWVTQLRQESIAIGTSTMLLNSRHRLQDGNLEP